MKSQNQEILTYLQEGNSITNAIAFTRFRITRLSARIYDLRQQGHAILAEKVKHHCNRTGRLVRYNAYYMEGS